MIVRLCAGCHNINYYDNYDYDDYDYDNDCYGVRTYVRTYDDYYADYDYDDDYYYN